ncbi:hypothetical protein EGJ23_23155 [Pseudomonas sp. o96-267]|nr:hypothetical protein EGJ23_23155 [Pseudomonas sp. o96-267]
MKIVDTKEIVWIFYKAALLTFRQIYTDLKDVTAIQIRNILPLSLETNLRMMTILEILNYFDSL